MIFAVLEFALAYYQFTQYGRYTFWDFVRGLTEVPVQAIGWLAFLFWIGAVVALTINAFGFM